MVRSSLLIMLSGVTFVAGAQTSIIDNAVGGKVDYMTLPSSRSPFTSTSQAHAWNSNPSNPRYFPDVYAHSVTKVNGVPYGKVDLTQPPGSSERGFEIIATRPNAPTDTRSEVSVLWEYSANQPRWYAMSVYIPTDFYELDTEQVIMQIHNQGFSPTLAVQVKKTEMSVVLKSTQQDGGPLQKQSISLGQLEKGKWYCLVANVGWSPTIGVGNMELYWNGKSVYNAINLSNTYPNQVNGNYPKVGIYIPGDATRLPTGFARQRVITDFIHISNDPAMTAYNMKSKTPCGQG